MAFFGNSAVNRVNLHYAIQMFAQASGGAFYFVFLLRAGVPLATTLLVEAGILAGRFVIRPLILPLAKRIGLKPALIAGSIAMAAQYPLLPAVHGVGVPLATVIAVSALGETFYWSCYHAYFAALGDAEHRGHQLGARQLLAGLLGVVAPLFATWSLVALGAWSTFGAVGLVQASSAVPLLGAPNLFVRSEAPGTLRAARLSLVMFAVDGWFTGCYLYVWQIALFETLKESYAVYGGALALAGAIGAVSGLLLGRQIDRGRGRSAVLVAYGSASVILLVRALGVGRPWLAVLANAPAGLLVALVVPSLMAAIYNLAKAAPCPLRFHIALEGGWDLGCASACCAAAALVLAGQSLAYALLLGVPSAAVEIWLLTRYYATPAFAATLDEPLPVVPLG